MFDWEENPEANSIYNGLFAWVFLCFIYIK